MAMAGSQTADAAAVDPGTATVADDSEAAKTAEEQPSTRCAFAEDCRRRKIQSTD